MTNTGLLKRTIRMSGIKKSAICDALGCVYATLRSKVQGKVEFTATEMYQLCDLLRIDGDTARQIFFATECECDSQNEDEDDDA